jgi:integrase/recombinase XerD
VAEAAHIDAPNVDAREGREHADRHVVRCSSAGRMVDLPTEGRAVMSTVELVPVGALFSPERVAVGFLAGYSGRTREAYALDLRMFGQWCTERHLDLFAVTRAHIELYARWLEEQGRARATIARRLSTIVSFSRYVEEEHLIAQSPAVHVRRPKLDYESRAVGLDRNEIGALLVAAGLGPAADHAFISLLALNGLRVSEALDANVEDLAVERGHRTLRVVRKRGKTVTIRLAPRTARAIDLAVGERVEGPIFLSVHGRISPPCFNQVP